MTPALNAFLGGVLFVGAAGALAIPETVQSNTIAGTANVVDGDTIIVAGSRVRLSEIDAPELAQPCTNAAGITWMCGKASQSALQGIVGRRSGYVTCQIRDHDRYGRSVGACATSEGDIAGQLVAIGLAVVYPHYSKGTYDDRQSAAQAEHLGMWSGTFVEPWTWRHAHQR